MAACTAWQSGISINPKPLQRPVSQSLMTCMVCHKAIGLKELTEVIGGDGHRRIGHRDMHVDFLGEM